MPKISEHGKTPADATSPGSSRSTPSTVGAAVRVVLVCAVLALLARQLGSGEHGLTLDSHFLVAVLLFQAPMLVGVLAYARRHAILVRTPPVPLRIALEAVLLSAMLNIVMPGRLSELVKATYLRKHIGVPMAHGLSAVLIERLLDVVIVGAIAATGVAALLRIESILVFLLPVIAFLALLVMRPVAAALIMPLSRRTGVAWNFLERQCRYIVEVVQGRIAVHALLLTIVSWLAHLAALYIFFKLVHTGSFSLTDVTLVFGAIVLAGAIPALPAGLGTFEAAVVLVLQNRGFEFNQALGIAVTLHIAELLPSAVLGPIVMLRRSMGIGEIARDALRALRADHR